MRGVPTRLSAFQRPQSRRRSHRLPALRIGRVERGRPLHLKFYIQDILVYWIGMPRKSRIDAPGALHHIVTRGIERRDIFLDDDDRVDFVDRLGGILEETETRCLAWALMSNHFHLLLKTGKNAIATVMRRVLTGYAVTFNRRHGRTGHLFQNRYKSILCQEEAYLLELVRYVHLNPIRAGIVKDLKALDRFAFTGHSALVGQIRRDWQDTGSVLGLYGEKLGVARKRYRDFILAGISQGRRQELTGGGLIRSAGGWEEVKRMREAKEFQKSDERILGDGAFVERVLSGCDEKMERRYLLKAKGYDVDKALLRVSDLMNMEPSMILRSGKERKRVQARGLFCYWAVRELGIGMSELSRKLGLSLAGISQSVKRGERIAVEEGYSLIYE
jgi:putative transposase